MSCSFIHLLKKDMTSEDDLASEKSDIQENVLGQ